VPFIKLFGALFLGMHFDTKRFNQQIIWSIFMSKDKYQVLRELHVAHGEMNYHLEIFGDVIAKREKYKDAGLKGINAVHYYLIHKFHWLPRDVRDMTFEDIRLVLSEELAGWTLPKDAR
jgi:hypothetical protein